MLVKHGMMGANYMTNISQNICPVIWIKDQKMREKMKQTIIIILLTLLTASCSTITTTPPYADPLTNKDYAYIRAVKNESENLIVHLASADNEYAATLLFEGHNVTEMYLLPGKHVLNVWCFKGGISMQLGMDLEIEFESKKSYDLTCKLKRGGAAATFVLTDSTTGEAKSYKYIRTTDSSGRNERSR